MKDSYNQNPDGSKRNMDNVGSSCLDTGMIYDGAQRMGYRPLRRCTYQFLLVNHNHLHLRHRHAQVCLQYRKAWFERMYGVIITIWPLAKPPTKPNVEPTMPLIVELTQINQLTSNKLANQPKDRMFISPSHHDSHLLCYLPKCKDGLLRAIWLGHCHR